MTRVIPDTRRLLLVALLGAAACATRPQWTPEMAAAAAANARWQAEQQETANETSSVNTTARILQLSANVDPATRANPYPCARAVYAAERNHTALPPCYYLPMGW